MNLEFTTLTLEGVALYEIQSGNSVWRIAPREDVFLIAVSNQERETWIAVSTSPNLQSAKAWLINLIRGQQPPPRDLKLGEWEREEIYWNHFGSYSLTVHYSDDRQWWWNISDAEDPSIDSGTGFEAPRDAMKAAEAWLKEQDYYKKRAVEDGTDV